MRALLISLLVILTFLSDPTPQQGKNFVWDKENILSEKEEATLNQMVLSHEDKTTNQILIMTTPDWGESDNIVDFSIRIGNTLGVGQKEKDNGVVIIFSKAQRQTRITTGYGTEKVLTDEKAKSIIDSLMIPKFREEMYYEGIHDGTKAIIDFLELPGNEIK
ncbi:TPM domain-containing protein [Roseivirga sp.]|uniref:TPM domain-containing protein n=1 Tax=Roseivirga sp. TaxID=1964215 RepID=UPI003B520694